MTFSQSAKIAWATTCAVGDLAGKLVRHGQSFLIYPAAFYPECRTEIHSPELFGLPYEIVQLCCSDGVKIEACLMLQTAATANRPTVFMFHGNGANYSMQLPLARQFYKKYRCNVFMLSYRGYGHSGGTPNEKGIRLDAQTALDYILKHDLLAQTRLILYGQSLGGAVSIDLASRNPDKVAALILENTFLSIPKMIPAVLPALAPFTVFCWQKWNSEKSITLIPTSTPMLFLSGLEDEVVPCTHMKRLHEIATEHLEDKSIRLFREFAAGTHNDTFLQSGYWGEIQRFIQSLPSSD
ncbi:alpha/beta-hydrolase [Auricularia subglabra TFB-10046 SS5]|nr:alpha/beta-hydrolase [Auricularia subglabra TFB-10046 SS5]